MSVAEEPLDLLADRMDRRTLLKAGADALTYHVEVVDDVVATAAALRGAGCGHVGITLKDETRLALGPNTDVRIDQFVYSPGHGSLRLVLKIARGLVAYVSGRIAKLSPDAVRLETPSAILGVRGTRMVIRVDRP